MRTMKSPRRIVRCGIGAAPPNAGLTRLGNGQLPGSVGVTDNLQKVRLLRMRFRGRRAGF